MYCYNNINTILNYKYIYIYIVIVIIAIIIQYIVSMYSY